MSLGNDLNCFVQNLITVSICTVHLFPFAAYAIVVGKHEEFSSMAVLWLFFLESATLNFRIETPSYSFFFCIIFRTL